jgi:hypothetical protein
MTGDLEAVEARLRAILEPYCDRLEANALYGVETLRRPGSKAHDFFAAVRVGSRHVSFHLMPVYTDPRVLEAISPALRKRMGGKSVFNFTTVDDGLLAELDALTARCFAAYEKRGAGGAGGDDAGS